MIIIVIIFLYYYAPWLSQCMKDKTPSTKESWTNYITPYFDYVRTTPDPPMFYSRPLYRLPYDYPRQFYKSYPYPNMSYIGRV